MRVLVLFLFLHASWLFAQNKPFQHVLVLSGGGLNIPAYVGIFDGLEKMGKKPDLVIGSCGASYAASLLLVQRESNKRMEFLKSEDFYRLVAQMKFRSSLVDPTYLSASFSEIAFRTFFGKKINPLVPPIFQQSFADLPKDLGKGTILDAFFEPSDSLSVIVQSARSNFKKEEVGLKRAQLLEKNGSLYSMTYFTDSKTARLFEVGGALEEYNPNKGFEGLFGRNAPFANKAEILVGNRMFEAARSSVADPYYIEPNCLENGECFVSGAADHYPFEFASALGEEVTMLQATYFSTAEQIAYLDIFGFDIHQRDRLFRKQPLTRVVDFSDFGMTQADGYNADEQGLNIQISLTEKHYRIQSRIPEEYGDEFRDRVQKLYEFGFQRAVEAAGVEKGSRKHIRKPAL